VETTETKKGFGMFAGVFRPVVLTILGAMLYLREGWLVGNSGLVGALGIIGIAYAITGTTALSLSTIATNVRVARGGSFAIISRALGLEAGGAIGVPLYVAQSISSVMYLYAFSEGWAVLFPSHNGMLVAAGGFVVVAAVALASASLAARAQALMLGVVAMAMISALAGVRSADIADPVMIGRFADVGPLGTFAIFFPAATGIMVGAGMSGELSNPRTALPRGTLLAWGTTLLAYVVFAFWYALIADSATLLTDKTVMVERAAFGQLVLAGLLSSTLMAALSSLVAAPRLLHAMAEYDIVPGSAWLKTTSASGEPRHAIYATLGLASLGLLSGSLDAIAPIITSCFLLTYLAVNAVVFLEQQLAMISFRPAWPIPKWIPAVGMMGCIVALGLSSPGGGLFEVLGVVGLYAWLTWRRLETPWETVHSGLAMTLAARLALWAATLEKSARSWKPDLLVPIADTKDLNAVAPLVRNMIGLQGSVKYTAIVDDPIVKKALDNEVRRLRQHGRFSSWHPMPSRELIQGIRLTMNVMRGTFFASNLLLVTDDMPQDAIQELRDHGLRTHIGMGLLILGPAGPPDQGRTVHVWLSDRSPEWQIGLKVANTDLPVLLGLLLSSPSRGRLVLHTAVRDPDQAPQARVFLNTLIEQGRLPASTQASVSTAPFMEALKAAGPADIHLLGLPQYIDLERLRAIRDTVDGPCLFLRDSGQESLLA
jgi:amino acid permease